MGFRLTQKHLSMKCPSVFLAWLRFFCLVFWNSLCCALERALLMWIRWFWVNCNEVVFTFYKQFSGIIQAVSHRELVKLCRYQRGVCWFNRLEPEDSIHFRLLDITVESASPSNNCLGKFTLWEIVMLATIRDFLFFSFSNDSIAVSVFWMNIALDLCKVSVAVSSSLILFWTSLLTILVTILLGISLGYLGMLYWKQFLHMVARPEDKKKYL